MTVKRAPEVPMLRLLLVVHAAAGVALLAVTAISVFKPWGRLVTPAADAAAAPHARARVK